MKQSKKIAGLLLLGLTTLMLTATVSAKAPSVASEIKVNLYQETGAECDPWKVDCATSVIPIKNLKWNATVSDIKSSTVKVTVCDRQPGTYYLRFKANEYIKPGSSANIRFVVKQDGEIYVLKTKLSFQVGESPFKSFKIGSNEYAPDFTGQRKVAAVVKSGVATVNAKLATGYTWVKIVYTNKKGVAHTFANGNKLKLGNLKKIEVVYKTPVNVAATKWLGGYYKAENCSYKCTKVFPVRNVATITF